MKGSFVYRISVLQDYAMGHLYENIEMVVYSAVCFFVPFFMGHPQLFVGIAVNAALVAASLNLRGYRLLPVIMIPSLGVLSRGIIFGPFSKFLVYMIPFIWIGNSILVLSFKHFRLHRNFNYWITLGLGSAFKAGFLFVSAFALYKLGVLPAMFLAAMGSIQLLTAAAGGIAAYGIHYGKKSMLNSG